MAVTFTRFENEWNAFLQTENCPPILGLVPLPEDHYATVSELIAGEFRIARHATRYQTFQTLLERYAAILAIWIARKSGEAYDAGAFWEKFAEKTGVAVPLNRRSEFAFAFRRACRHCMANYTAPTELGTRKYVEAFLYQAGIPLDQCRLYAQMLRSIERQYGLPDPDSQESGEELRTMMLIRSELAGHPMLRKALQGPAGAYLCDAALNSISNSEFAGVNPRLRDELAREFEHQQVRRAARAPFLRLSEDYCSLELVGPRQEEHLVVGRIPEWRVDGERYRVPRFDDLIVPLGNQTRITVELRGLAGGLTVLRTFVLNLRDREQPFMVFDYATRKLRRDADGADHAAYLQSGPYWLLHTTDTSISNAEQTIEWSDGERQLSLIRLQPGSEVRLELPGGGTICLKPNQSPFLEPNGEILETADEERIHFRWPHLPIVWLPTDENGDVNVATWKLQATIAGQQYCWPLMSDPEISPRDGMIRCLPSGHTVLAALAPKLHEVDVTVFHGTRPKVNERFLYWVGLQRISPAFQFIVSELPENLDRQLCRGFSFSNQAINHLSDHAPEHTLGFGLGSGTRTFKWCQAGTFLYSAEKRPGMHVQWMLHSLGQSFSASVDSSRWLRIRREPMGQTELLIISADGRSQEQVLTRPFIDLSLADMATRFPAGGRIALRWSGLETSVARFTRPLIPLEIKFLPADEFIVLDCRFTDSIRHVRPRVRELTTARVLEYGQAEFGVDGQQLFIAEEFPTIICSYRNSDSNSAGEAGKQVELHVPKSGWPTGFWVIQLEVRQSDTNDWQVVTDEHHSEIALLVTGLGSDIPNDFRFTQFRRAYSTIGYRLSADEVTGHEQELCDLLSEIQTLMRNGFAEAVLPQFRWLEDLYRELGKHAGRALTTSGDQTTERLLNLACQETQLMVGRSLFVGIPGLLALPAERYSEIPAGQPLSKALQWCGRLARHSSVLAAFKDSAAAGHPWTLTLLSHFRNFPELAATPDAEGDLTDFDYMRYQGQTIGDLCFRRRDDIPTQFEWEDGNALSRSHVAWALSELARRRQEAHEYDGLGMVNTLLHASPGFRSWLQHAVQPYSGLMLGAIWERPWLPIKIEDDDFMEYCSRFASLLALAARAAAFAWLDFDGAINWLSKRIDVTEVTERTIATLVGMAPELFGYYLMFWELMIRTDSYE